MALGRGSGIMSGAPDHVDQLLEHDQPAHGDEDLLQVVAVHRADEHALEEPAEQSGERDGGQHRGDHRREVGGEAAGSICAAHAREHGGRAVGADRDEDAVREVHHVHQAEDQRQARGHHEDHHPHREAGDGERDPGRRAADRAAAPPARSAARARAESSRRRCAR